MTTRDAGELVEAVARAICERHSMYPADMLVVGRNGETVPYWTEFADDARAAISIVSDEIERLRAQLAEARGVLERIKALPIAPISNEHAGAINGKTLIQAKAMARTLGGESPKQETTNGPIT